MEKFNSAKWIKDYKSALIEEKDKKEPTRFAGFLPMDNDRPSLPKIQAGARDFPVNPICQSGGERRDQLTAADSPLPSCRAGLIAAE